jgi:hypothetical protein
LISGHEQLGADAPSTQWIVAIQKALPDGGNIYTTIAQEHPRELSLARRGPVACTSVELYWLANWLESKNFPAANFLVPMSEPSWRLEEK